MKALLQIVARVAELERKQANMLRIGTVKSVDAAAARCVVALGKNFDTAPVPWLTFRAGANARTFAAPSVGEQVLVFSPCGEIGNAVVLPALNCDAFTPPAGGENIDRILYPDGTVVTYDHAAHALIADVKGTADLTTTGNASATIGGTFTGTVAKAISITGNATADVTIAADLTATVGANLTATVTAAATVNVAGPSVAINAPTAAVTLTAMNVAVTATGGITITAAATIALTAPSVAITAAAFSLSGSLSIGGAVTVAGAITGQGDIVAGEISLLTHKHKYSDSPTTPPIP
jgi:phage baseplate assembly protein V